MAIATMRVATFAPRATKRVHPAEQGPGEVFLAGTLATDEGAEDVGDAGATAAAGQLLADRMGEHDEVAHAPFVHRMGGAAEDEVDRLLQVASEFGVVAFGLAIEQGHELGFHRRIREMRERILGVDVETRLFRGRQLTVPLELHQASTFEQPDFGADVVVDLAAVVLEMQPVFDPAPRTLLVADDVDLIGASRELVTTFAGTSEHQDLAITATAAGQIGQDIARTKARHGTVELTGSHGHGGFLQLVVKGTPSAGLLPGSLCPSSHLTEKTS